MEGTERVPRLVATHTIPGTVPMANWTLACGCARGGCDCVCLASPPPTRRPLQNTPTPALTTHARTRAHCAHSQYIRTLVRMSNEKLQLNFDKIDRFFKDVQAHFGIDFKPAAEPVSGACAAPVPFLLFLFFSISFSFFSRLACAC